jgi:hypothetical protein
MVFVDKDGTKRPSYSCTEACTALIYTSSRIKYAETSIKDFLSKRKYSVHAHRPDVGDDTGMIVLTLVLEGDLVDKIKAGFKIKPYESEDEGWFGDWFYDYGLNRPDITWIAESRHHKEPLRSRYWYTDIHYVYSGKYINDIFAGDVKRTPHCAPEYLDILQNVTHILKKNALRSDGNW